MGSIADFYNCLGWPSVFDCYVAVDSALRHNLRTSFKRLYSSPKAL